MSDIVDLLRAGLADRYRIERELGRGGMATVYLAEDLKHRRAVALKVLRPELTATIGPERFLREIEFAARLQHPHILPLFDSGRVGDGPGVFYYVMPYIADESLRARLAREHQLAVEDAVRIALEVADALAAAHAQGIVHRDIKPENIMLSAGHALVADFGIARALRQARAAPGGTPGGADGGEEPRLTDAGVALGTPAYMSPEQATAGDVDGRADIYALGCVLYEMLAGAPPFTGTTAQAILARHSLDTVPSMRTVRSSVPEPVERVVLRALGKVPADRYATAREFADALTRAASSQGITPAPHRPRVRRMVLFGLSSILAATLWWIAGGANRLTGAGRGAGEPVPRVAILSFANLSPDTADAYLARGISEEIGSRLGEFPALNVASRSSVERLERTGPGELLDRARALGFGYVVEGSVRRAGERVRVSARLVEADEGVRRWDRSYDRPTTDILALQDEIAIEVAKAVAGHLVPADGAGRTGPRPSSAAHDQLLRGNYYVAQRNPRGLARGLEAYAQATRLDPTFAPGFAKLAHAYLLFLDWGWSYEGLPPESLLARGWRAAERAVELDTMLAEGWLARGALLRFDDERGFAGVREALQRAVDLEPGNAEAHHEFGMVLRLLGEDSAAAEQFRLALGIEPDRPMSLVHLGWIDMSRRRYGEARRWLDSAAAVNPGFFQAYMGRAQLRLATGDTAGARADAETTVRLRPASDPLAAEDVLLALDLRSGDTAAARARIARLRPAAPGPGEAGVHQATAWAALLVAAGQYPEAIAFLERARVPPSHLRIHLEEPKFGPLRAEPRFARLMEALRVRRTGQPSPTESVSRPGRAGGARVGDPAIHPSGVLLPAP
ncbi:MAG TPA: protein kinase [Gemmatimonadales bacterium]|nr:protein kinase [Gemmatimonadales bacterium]